MLPQHPHSFLLKTDFRFWIYIMYKNFLWSPFCFAMLNEFFWKTNQIVTSWEVTFLPNLIKIGWILFPLWWLQEFCTHTHTSPNFFCILGFSMSQNVDIWWKKWGLDVLPSQSFILLYKDGDKAKATVPSPNLRLHGQLHHFLCKPSRESLRFTISCKNVAVRFIV